jgi:hypothetical protein
MSGKSPSTCAFSVHRCTAETTRIEAKRAPGGTCWINIWLDGNEHEITLFCNSVEEFPALCQMFGVEFPEVRKLGGE